VWAAMAMLTVELFVITAIGFACSSFLGQTVSAVVTVGLYLAGHLSGDLYRFATKAGGVVASVGHAVYYALPNLDPLLDLVAVPLPIREHAQHQYVKVHSVTLT